MRVGILGFGFMGRMHHRCWRAVPDARVVALCDTDPGAIADPNRGAGNIQGATGEVDLTGVELYADPAEMFARARLDAVSVALPTHLHGRWSIAALEAGLHVLCEKPMARRLDEAQAMIAAAERAGRILQIGHCIRFWPEYAAAKEIVDGGAFGRVIAASFARFAATTHGKAGSWFTDEQRSGGMAYDLHIHDTDFVQHMFGVPRAVTSHGAPGPAGALIHILTRYDCGDERLVSAECGWAMTPSFGFQMRFLIALERATISFDHARTPRLMLCPADGPALSPPVPDGDGYARQIAHFAARVRGEALDAVITPHQARNSLRIVDAECRSVREGRPVEIE